MTRPSPKLVSAGLAAALALGACGGEPRPIPRAQAAALIADLEEAQRRSDAGACNDLRKGTFLSLDRKVERLPDDVDGDVEQALRDGVGHLKNVAEEECGSNRRPAATTNETDPETTPAPTTTAPTTTTPPADAPKDEEPDEQQTEPPPPKNPDPPSETPGGAPAPTDGQGGAGKGATGMVPPALVRAVRQLGREGGRRLRR